jgi:ADP-dependent NAD(P)H-hydrate dehydratase / NAD(P)H-hydrate epimerase
MRPVLSGQRMRAFDRHAIDVCGVPSLVLMENAGRGAAERLQARSKPRERVLVVCGLGNNGGDGFVVARHLLGAGYPVDVALLGMRSGLTKDAASNAAAWCGVGGTLLEVTSPKSELARLALDADWIVDAIFGTGLARPVAGMAAEAVDLINASTARVVALDLPSGIEADTGEVLGSAVRAERTVAFGHFKPAHFSSVARPFVGDVEVVDLGVPSGLVAAVGFDAELSESSDVSALLALRPKARHKGDSGKVLLLAGSKGSFGAARLSGYGALRAGAGLCKVATFAEAARALEVSDVETMTTELDPTAIEHSLAPLLEWADVVVVGPGFGMRAESVAAVECVVRHARVPVVLDADGINAFAGRPEALAEAHQLLLTPHPGEAGRLLDMTVSEVERDRFRASTRLAESTGAVVLLKGECSLIARRDEPLVVNVTGTPLLAVGGSGDVLSGLLGALCCHLGPRDAAIAGAWLHGRAAELRQNRGVDCGVFARELADELPELMYAMTHPEGTGDS